MKAYLWRWDPLFWRCSPMRKALKKCHAGVDAGDLNLVRDGLSEVTAAIDMYYIKKRNRWAECLFWWVLAAFMWGVFIFCV